MVFRTVPRDAKPIERFSIARSTKLIDPGLSACNVPRRRSPRRDSLGARISATVLMTSIITRTRQARDMAKQTQHSADSPGK